MISLENLLLFVPLAAILVVLPGPDFALITKISLLDGRPQGQAAACGVALGIVIHTSAAMLGISAIIAQSVFLFSVLKYIGAVYLFWLGVQTLRQGRAVGQAVVSTAPLPGRDAEESPEEAARPVSRATRIMLWRAFKQGLLTNILNPKAVLIFLTFLPQFMNPHMPLAPQFLELGGIMSALCLCWYVPLAYMLGHVRKAFESSRFQQWLQRCTGVVFIAFGLKLVAARND
ncbi:LysE family translocator [uncultured Desulfovibrio sp.]|uniref:LysE family translocator n=1 Tax=uncultured Desulfovibrio sp. TaxID=167968 RepID=UPI00261BFB75|nr:LysE family translocator [uncultured Desulfovibrio sp.]